MVSSVAEAMDSMPHSASQPVEGGGGSMNEGGGETATNLEKLADDVHLLQERSRLHPWCTQGTVSRCQSRRSSPCCLWHRPQRASCAFSA